MSVPKSKYKVYIYKNDYNAMCGEVYKHQHIETGGNLFGLWTASGDAMIHVALGPGQKCKRTSTSFHQDLEYMARVGRFVNDGYMLCHIGEWHSHHNLSLSQPSAGDESTIRRNFPQGVSKFLVIIANIRNRDTIKLSPYFFTDGGTRYEIAKYVVLDSNSPFSTDDVILPHINFGAEGKKTATKLETNSKPNSLDDLVYQREPDSEVNLNTPTSSTDRSLVDSPDISTVQITPCSGNNPGEPPLDDEAEPMDTDDSDLKPPGDEDRSSASPENVKRENILEKIHDCLKFRFDVQAESMFKYETSKDTPGADKVSFKHNSKYWMIRFPKDFPANTAKLSYGYSYGDYNKCSDSHTVEPLTNEVSILLAIKNICGGACEVCKHITAESCSSSHFMGRLFGFLNALVTKLDTSLNVNAVNANLISKTHADITFEHANKYWTIVLPARFPDVPAKVYYLPYEGSSQKHDAMLYLKSSSDPQDLNTIELIIEAIQSVE